MMSYENGGVKNVSVFLLAHPYKNELRDPTLKSIT